MRTIFFPVSVTLKKLRKERGFSQQELARKLNITRTCLANYESGSRQPDNATLVRIADFFHVTVDFIVNRSAYRNLELSPEELNEFTYIKYKLENHGCTLSLTPLSVEGRVAVIEYYEHLTNKK
ncbi:MAG: helix-turn-helix transcriptional regulator [Clostridia bacterium]|nr:helix-turn-helix transcriptional regulator [Clostridia bacterium]